MIMEWRKLSQQVCWHSLVSLMSSELSSQGGSLIVWIHATCSSSITDFVDSHSSCCHQFSFSTMHPSTLVFVSFYGLDWVATVPPTLILCRIVLGKSALYSCLWLGICGAPDRCINRCNWCSCSSRKARGLRSCVLYLSCNVSCRCLCGATHS